MKTPQRQQSLPEEPPKHQHPTSTRGWYAEARFKPGMVLPLTVLWVLSEHADANGLARIEDVKKEINHSILYECLNYLTSLGRVRLVGVDVQILTTPATKAA
jgi:hypothetical protein